MSKITLQLLKKIFPGTPNSKLERFVVPLNEILPRYGITTKNRFAAFIGNVGVESDRLKALEEYASGAAYEGRAGLGNIRKGDGVRYKGRDIMQTTGRYNYWKVVVAYLRVLTGKDWYNKLADTNFDKYLQSQEYTNLLAEADKYNVNFLANPELLEVFPHAVEAACVFVKDNNLNYYADKGPAGFFAYSGIINTGSPKRKAGHYNERTEIYNLAMSVIPDNFNLKDTSQQPKNEKVTVGSEDIGEPLSPAGTEASVDQGVPTPPPSLVPVVTPVIEVEQVTAATEVPKDTSEEESVLTKIGNKANAAYTSFGTMIAGAIAWFSGSPVGIVAAIMGCVALLGITYMVINWRRNESKEKRETNIKLERERLETELKLQREKQAFELQKITLESAMRKDLNTVRIVPPPVEMPNSDPEI